MLPVLNEISDNAKKYLVRFRGVNYSEEHIEGDFSHTENVSSVLSPCMSQRFAREKQDGDYEGPQGICSKDKMLVINNKEVKYDSNKVGDVTEGKKQLATIGNYIVIFPDKKYYNVETKEFGDMEIEWPVRTDDTVKGKAKFVDGKTIELLGENEGFSFEKGDGVTISGCTTEKGNNKTVVIKEATEKKLTFAANTFKDCDESDITIKRSVPDMEVICESNYRLWGAKGNTIYASKYSDPLNFQVFESLSSDSYYIDVGSDGEFTGCIQYSSHICFFKENVLHKLYGSKPSNFQIVTSQVYGVQAGSERSLRTINETLFYKGVNGVYIYNGGIPELISSNFGTKRFSEACAESDGERYYISMRCGDEWGLFTYDISKGVWLREDDTHCVDMTFHDGNVYMLTKEDADGGHLIKIDPDTREKDIKWSLTFCPFTETVNEKKVYSRFHLRMELAEKSWLTVEIRRDNALKWQTVYTTHNEKARTVTIPVIPARCDSVEIRLSGKGECVLRTFVREFLVGSDV